MIDYVCHATEHKLMAAHKGAWRGVIGEVVTSRSFLVPRTPAAHHSSEACSGARCTQNVFHGKYVYLRDDLILEEMYLPHPPK